MVLSINSTSLKCAKPQSIQPNPESNVKYPTVRIEFTPSPSLFERIEEAEEEDKINFTELSTVHINGIDASITQNDILAVASMFGIIAVTTKVINGRYINLQMEAREMAEDLINSFSSELLKLKGITTKVSWSKKNLVSCSTQIRDDNKFIRGNRKKKRGEKKKTKDAEKEKRIGT
ncbi:hypothetical protein BY996DRAFT_8693424 [Phakopsora pachyrhizi]|nr:hypothetical protein BY996DRAFT_8693424 [Phakopsora pachyrhizi]